MNDRPNVSASNLIAVEVSNTQSHIVIDFAWAEKIVLTTLGREGISAGTISLVFTDDAAIRVINARHLGHDWATDVISFGFDEDSDGQLGGEVIISVETARKMAAQFCFEPLDELALYLVHGLLHVCGYDDQSSDDRTVMRGRETDLLTILGIDLPRDITAKSMANSSGLGPESAPWPL